MLVFAALAILAPKGFASGANDSHKSIYKSKKIKRYKPAKIKRNKAPRIDRKSNQIR
ncbi:MAG: hypothetical protein M3N41_14275 [Acidobacteriota bacterium]|nr:hypothetical protein [Acidobacteriota bacterium]